MPEMFNVLPPAEALKVLFDQLPSDVRTENIASADSLDRVLAEKLTAPSSLPSFPRSTMDGYAVRAKDTFGATESLPAYLTVIGEVPMGRGFEMEVGPAQAVTIYTGGMIPPGEFIGLAEQTGLIRPLTDWVMEAGLRTAHALLGRGIRQPIAINLSARNLRDEHLLRKVQQLQDRLGNLGGLLELEITETALMDDAEYALRILTRLHEA